MSSVLLGRPPRQVSVDESSLTPQVPVKTDALRFPVTDAHSALEKWYAALDPLVRHIIRKHYHQTNEHDDLAQEAWLRIYRSLPKYDPEKSPPSTWVAQITKCTIIDRRRRASCRIQPQPFSDFEASPQLKCAQVAPPPTSLTEVKACVAQPQDSGPIRLPGVPEKALRKEQEEVFQLHYGRGLTMEDIAIATGRPLGTVKSLISRGLKRLRAHMEEGNG